MAGSPDETLVFLLDVDNTLLDNDRLKDDLGQRIEKAVGATAAARFWDLYEDVRQEKGYVDFPTTVERLGEEGQFKAASVRIKEILDSWNFKRYLYPHVMAAIAYLDTLGTTVILSDGDSVFQPRKIRDSGLGAAVGGRVLVYVHKETELTEVFRRYPASHYVLIDDKPRILSILERECPTQITTVLVQQGKYAAQASDFSPAPDCVIKAIGDVTSLTRQQFLDGCGSQPQKPQSDDHQKGADKIQAQP